MNVAMLSCHVRREMRVGDVMLQKRIVMAAKSIDDRIFSRNAFASGASAGRACIVLLHPARHLHGEPVRKTSFGLFGVSWTSYCND